MRRAILRFGLVVVPLLTMAVPAAAGGWATVRLDQPPGEVVVEVPWTVGFTVLQHDVRPTNDVEPRLDARHQETGESVRATGRQEGAEGHFVASVTFPLAGAWKWSIMPEPFAATSFETLMVASKAGEVPVAGNPTFGPSADLLGARITAGTCADGDESDRLALKGAPRNPPSVEKRQAVLAPVGGPSAIPVQTSVMLFDARLADLLSGRHAIVILAQTGAAATGVACGDIGGTITAGGLAIGLGERNRSGHSGVAILKDDGDRTEVTLYVMRRAAAAAPASTAGRGAAEIYIAAGAFVPATLTVPSGTTVTWRNDDAVTHTVMGEQLTFDDSGILDRGQSFSQVLTEPGTYRYRCGPHPSMQGTVVVE